MATVINNPGERGGDGGSGAGVVIGAVLVILILVILVVLGLPYIRNQFRGGANDATIKVDLPDNLPTGGNNGGNNNSNPAPAQ